MNANASEPTSRRVWRTAGGDASRRGSFPDQVTVGRRPMRRLRTQGAVQASVVFAADGRAFVADMAGHLQAFSPGGGPLWDTPVEGGISATPVLGPDDSRLYAGTHLGWVYALEAQTGQVVWRKALASKSDPRILSDLLFDPAAGSIVLSSWGGRFVALDAGTGEERTGWDAGISPRAAATADAAGNRYCLRAVASQGIEFVRVGLTGEATVLHHEPEGSRGARRALVAAAPVLDEAHQHVYLVFNGDQECSLVAWSLTEGRIRWREAIAVGVQATPAVRADGAVVVADLAGVVHGFSALGWRFLNCRTDGEYFLAGPVADGSGTVFVGDPVGQLHVIEADGRGRVRCTVPRAIQGRVSFDPAGNLYVPATDRTVYVLAGRRAG